ncbi:MAG: hypothetical protein ABS46_01195 [Cytophagaceae bacterium SCN 52-12]|nr:MAG: hypothetical protein ABS46_01195 [Cytophagaceae bacterium SCN 52-12]
MKGSFCTGAWVKTVACLTTGLWLLYACKPKPSPDANTETAAAQQMDSLYKLSNSNMVAGRFETGIVPCRQGIALAEAHHNDTMLVKLYSNLELYYHYRKPPDRDSVAYYLQLLLKHAYRSGDKRILMFALGKKSGWFTTQSRYDSVIATSRQRLLLAKELGDEVITLETQMEIGYAYEQKGDDDTALQCYNSALDIYTSLKEQYGRDTVSKAVKKLSFLYAQLLDNFSDYFFRQKDYVKSLDYLKEREASLSPQRRAHNPGLFISMGDCFEMLGQPDSAMKYYRTALQHVEESWYFRRFYVIAGRKYGALLVKRGRVKEGESYLAQSLRSARESNEPQLVVDGRVALAESFARQRQWRIAQDTLFAAAELAKKINSKAALASVYRSLYEIYTQEKDYERALQYSNLFHAYADSITSAQQRQTVAEMDAKYQAFKKSQQIALLQKDNRIQQLQLTAARRLKLFYISGGIVSLVLLGAFYYYRQQQQRRRLQRMKAELETKALRAQMNPHFIFNSLNAIQELVMTENYTASCEYLSRFSKLMRMVLEASEKNFHPLRAEIEITRLYIELESLRFRHLFRYSIRLPEAIDADSISFPSLLLQPFVENAIWHGLLQKEGVKELEVTFSEKENRLTCAISDNGIGREKAQLIKMRKLGAHQSGSKGIPATRERLEILKAAGECSGDISISDRLDDDGHVAGTLVEITIVFNENSNHDQDTYHR